MKNISYKIIILDENDKKIYGAKVLKPRDYPAEYALGKSLAKIAEHIAVSLVEERMEKGFIKKYGLFPNMK